MALRATPRCHLAAHRLAFVEEEVNALPRPLRFSCLYNGPGEESCTSARKGIVDGTRKETKFQRISW
jgi:hypothetical protein